MKVVFPYFAQLHHVMHSLPIAAELAMRYPEVRVHAAGATAEHQAFIRDLLSRHAPRADIVLDRLARPPLRMRRAKRKTMEVNLDYLRRFDAVVVPERTSLHLRADLPHTKMIWTRHGAGDRAVGFASDVHRFDFVLLAGEKIEQRLLADRLIRPGHYAAGIYAKFDWVRNAPPVRLFGNDRPTVLYAPHFDEGLSSFPRLGMAILEFFAAHPRWNLIFAPHVRMFDRPSWKKYTAFRPFLNRPNVHIDLGSTRSVDMTYTNAADVYLGDVSSQVVEFVARPRPCLFLNPGNVEWRGHPDYGFWEMGPVIDGLGDLGGQLDHAVRSHGDFLPAQRRYLRESFGAAAEGLSAPRAAVAIVGFLAAQQAAGERAMEPALQSA